MILIGPITGFAAFPVTAKCSFNDILLILLYLGICHHVADVRTPSVGCCEILGEGSPNKRVKAKSFVVSSYTSNKFLAEIIECDGEGKHIFVAFFLFVLEKVISV